MNSKQLNDVRMAKSSMFEALFFETSYYKLILILGLTKNVMKLLPSTPMEWYCKIIKTLYTESFNDPSVYQDKNCVHEIFTRRKFSPIWPPTLIGENFYHANFLVLFKGIDTIFKVGGGGGGGGLYEKSSSLSIGHILSATWHAFLNPGQSLRTIFTKN